MQKRKANSVRPPGSAPPGNGFGSVKRTTVRERQPTPVTGRPGAPTSEAPASRPSRKSIREDDVGAAALLGTAPRSSLEVVPRPSKARSDLSSAPIGPKEAFVLSLVDGSMSIGSIVDMSAMPEPDVVEILDRLRRLGLVSLG